MVTNNKVLTVSYGTFSCTLEGFDDSFDTMKAIAEYFRDLAGDDRYFGAEPPTPDAEMLARIAEREIERRVSARVDHGAIVLRATPTAAPVSEPTITEPVAEPVAEPEAASDPVSETPTAQQDTPELSDDPINAAEAEASDNADAQIPVTDEPAISAPEIETSDDRADTAPQQAEAELAETQTAPETDASEDIAAEITSDIDVATDLQAGAEQTDVTPNGDAQVEAELIEEVVEDTAPAEQVVPTADMLVLESSDKVPAETPVAESDEPRSDPAVNGQAAVSDQEFSYSSWDEDDDSSPEYEENSIAAKLERIRAVVARVESQPDPEDFSEDEHAQDVAETDDFGPITLDRIDAALTEDVAPATPKIHNHSENGDAALADAQESEPASQQQAPQEDTAPAAPLRARVVRMKKADFEDAVASGLLEAEPVGEDEGEDEIGDEFGEDDSFVAPADTGTSLTPEDEADLLAELAQVEAELKQSDIRQAAKTSTDDDATFFVEAEAPAEVFEDQPQAEDPFKAEESAAQLTQPEPDLSRLMAKADSEMEEPEGNRRRRAIAHLRAAVAATKADKEAGHAPVPHDDTTAYRDDLASVVRAVPGGKTTPRDAKDRAAAPPLKLVAEQRIDSEPTQSQTQDKPAPQKSAPRRDPVRPRRVSSDRMDRDEIARTTAPISSSAAVQGGFMDYATNVGATHLPEVLEAAAAYVTFVEGHERFSRPMLMRMARDVNEAEYTREAGLRSFGQLLRDKKIEKINGGRFTATVAINYKPQDRAAS